MWLKDHKGAWIVDEGTQSRSLVRAEAEALSHYTEPDIYLSIYTCYYGYSSAEGYGYGNDHGDPGQGSSDLDPVTMKGAGRGFRPPSRLSFHQLLKKLIGLKFDRT